MSSCTDLLLSHEGCLSSHWSTHAQYWSISPTSSFFQILNHMTLPFRSISASHSTSTKKTDICGLLIRLRCCNNHCRVMVNSRRSRSLMNSFLKCTLGFHLVKFSGVGRNLLMAGPAKMCSMWANCHRWQLCCTNGNLGWFCL